MGLGDFFKSKTKVKTLQTPQEAKARGFLASLMDTPQDIPTEQIAGLSAAEQQAAGLAQQFGATTPEGLGALRDIAGDTSSFAQSPSGRALLEEVTRIGQEETGRVGRSMQLRGGASSTTGRDVLGQSVADTQRNLLATLAPYELQQQQNRITAAQALQATGDSAVLNRLNALSQTGAVERQLQQLQLSAEHARKMQQIQQPVMAAQSLLSMPAQQAVVQSKSQFAQIAEPIAALLQGASNAGSPSPTTTGGGGSATAAAGGGQGAAQKAAMMAAFSDRRIKENIKPVVSAREKIKALGAYTYNFIGNEQPRVGLMAQDVEKVLPEAVLEQDGIKMVDMYAIQSLIVAALAEEFSEVA